MKNLTRYILGNCALVIAFAFSQCIVGQNAPSSQANGNVPNAEAASSPSQAEAPAKPAQAPDDGFVIGNDDVLAISVWKEAELTRSVPVRSDGKISLALVGELQAAGRTPVQVQQDIAARLRSFITDPQVTVIVEQINSQRFNILGEVMKPGSYPLKFGTTIVDAIATAGGFRDFAKKKSVYILRQGSSGNDLRIDFNYQDFIKGKNTDKNVAIKAHDNIVVP